MDVWEQRFEMYRDRRWMHVGRCAGCEHERRCDGGGLHFFDPERGELSRCHVKLMEDAGLDPNR